ncbi:MAG: hypothetical protein R3A80_00045 [Bdellovibrionota bacterium]
MRVNSALRKSGATQFFLTITFIGVFSAAEAKTKSTESSSSSSLATSGAVDPTSGELRVSQINSCSTLDRIPWVPKTAGKRTRRIFRDELRLDREKIFSVWELYQVLAPDGEVSFIFQRIRKDGKEEFIAAKGAVTERIMEVRKGRRRLVDKQNMKPLINRTAISMMHKDGSRVEFIPGQTGKSTVVLFPTNDAGVSLAPVYLKGISCDKPESFNDDDINSKDLGQKGKEGRGSESGSGSGSKK